MDRPTFQQLLKERPRLDIEIGVPVIDRMVEKHNYYYKKVVFYIRCLGADTEINGHSKELDDLKNEAYKLIGL